MDHSISERIDELADRFEAAWNTEHVPEIEEFLDGCPPALRLPGLAELIRIDAAIRSRRGEVPQLASYIARFPELNSQHGFVRELRQYWGRFSTVEGYGSLTAKPPTVRHDALDQMVQQQLTIGRFTLQEELGSGSFGTVYRAFDDRLRRHVAVKVLRSAATAGAEERERFLRESRSLAQLRHDSIVSVHEAGEHRGVPYLVSELIGGKTLHETIAQRRFAPRQAAEIIAELARALDHAHRQGVVHRDVKPSNILLNEHGRPVITDFGLAKRSEAEATMTAAGQVLGTPAYMSPEQAAGKLDYVDHRTDVYSLGVVLYELLSGERPFRGELRMLLLQVQFDEPRPPRRLDDNIPQDLETICLKAISKEPTSRYQTALALAEDLERFLRGEPIHARPVSRIRRSARFCRRNWKVVVPSAVASLAAAMLGIIITLNQIAAANLRATTAQQQAQSRRREVLVERLQRVRLREHTNGWSQQAEALIGQAAAIRKDADLRDFAAASLAGLDAIIVKQFPKLSASSVAFDGEGKQLLLGGFGEQSAHLYTFRKPQGGPDDRLSPLGISGSGPVAFAPSGKTLQLLVVEPAKLSELGVEANKPLVLFDCEDGKPLASFPLALPGNLRAEPLLTALTPSGAQVAAAVAAGDKRGLIMIWDAETEMELARWSHTASAIAIAPDGTMVAAGDDQGRVTVWSVSDGARVGVLAARRNKITALAFQYNPRRAPNPSDPMSVRDPWLLAAGDSGGTVTVWNVTAGVPVSFCRGAYHEVTAVAFSPDATRVAGGAHAEVRIWDSATGQQLLRVDPNASQTGKPLQTISGLTFAPDGTHLAISSLELYSPAVAVLLELQDGRGIRTLRGLAGVISEIRFSPDDRYVAALSHGWEIGIWRVADSRLLRVFDAPAGFVADNAAMAISSDGRQLAFSAARDARLWEIETGKLLASWKLPPGLQDELAFAPDGELHLLRFEARDEQWWLRRGRDEGPEDDCICRVRRLKRDGTLGAPLVERDDFADWRIKQLLLAPDASYFLGTAERIEDGSIRSKTLAFEVASGRLLWSGDVEGLGDSRSGPLAVTPAADGRGSLFELPSGRFLFRSPPWAGHIGAGRRLASGVARQIGDEHLGRTVYRIGQDEPILTLGIDRRVDGAWVQFSLDETLLAWAHPDGRLQIADLPTIQRQLARFGLGW